MAAFNLCVSSLLDTRSLGQMMLSALCLNLVDAEIREVSDPMGCMAAGLLDMVGPAAVMDEMTAAAGTGQGHHHAEVTGTAQNMLATLPHGEAAVVDHQHTDQLNEILLSG